METVLEVLGSIRSAALAVAGISFLIFIHEVGHFVAARIFGVRVETFSIGFGPRLFGLRRGDTDYRVSVVPLGGYVKMAGEYGDYVDDARLAEDDLNAKPAWQRAIIFAGGVIVNFAFAFVAFPVVFALGVPFTAPVIGAVTPGGPAWEAGLVPGDEIFEIGGRRVFEFSDIRLEAALGDASGMQVRARRGRTDLLVEVQPRRNEDEGRFELGIEPTVSDVIVVTPRGPAAAAGLRDGDRLVSVDGRDVGRDNASLVGALAAFRAGEPSSVVVLRDGVRVQVEIVPAEFGGSGAQRKLGIAQAAARVIALRGSVWDRHDPPLHPGDILLTIAGRIVTDEAGVREALVAAGGAPARVTVRRGTRTLPVELSAAVVAAILAGDVALGPEPDSARVRVAPGSAVADAGLQDGDVIRAVNGVSVTGHAGLLAAIADAGSPRISVRFDRPPDDREQTIVIEARPVVVPDYGFALQWLQVSHRLSLGEAVRAGIETSINSLRTTWLTLAKLISGDVGTKNISGIVGISQVTYQQAGLDLRKLLFFLALLSINLGFVNILPIPVLDGGQMLFLLFEKIKGSRLSERFLNAAQITGLAAILLLVVYVTYNDIQRIIG